jgi:GT2 family glycosyltransferase
VNGHACASVVVASHARALRLRWLLNALEEQTLTEPWEVVVVHDYAPDVAARVIERHPLAEAGRLRHVAIEPGSGSPARQRNVGWRDARSELVAFLDDDCRPDARWLERLVAGARGSGGAVVQGATRPDPLEYGVLAAPHVRTMSIEPVNRYVQTCNVAYPRALLERLGGFDERAVTGEDVDLALRARAGGARIVAAPDAVAYHAIESFSLAGIVRANLKWRYLALLVRNHPELRRELPLRVFWDEDHMWTALAVAGLAGARANRFALALAAPWLRRALSRRGGSPRGVLVAALEAPGQLVRGAGEVAGLAVGSARHRTLVL